MMLIDSVSNKISLLLKFLSLVKDLLLFLFQLLVLLRGKIQHQV